MSSLLPFIMSGIIAGTIYGLAGAGLVLTYKTSGIFNFGHGALATVAAYAFYWMNVDLGWDWRVCFFLSVLVLGPLLGLLMEPFARQLTRQVTAYKVVGTVGLILLVQGLATLKYGADPQRFPQFLPGSQDTFSLFGVTLDWGQVLVAGISVTAVAALYALFQFTRLGVTMRAVVDDPELLDVQGTNPTLVRRIAWIIGCTFAAASGVLVAPQIGLDSLFLTFLVVQAFGAAAIGAFSSIPWTFFGGIVVGVVASVSRFYVLDYNWLLGLPASAPFIILFVVLLVLPKRKLASSGSSTARPHIPYKAPPALRGLVGIVALGALGLVPGFAGTNIGYYTSALTVVILVLSLGLLVKTSGQVSLCHAVFAAIGATTFSLLTVDHGLPWLVALPLAAAAAVPVGAVIAIPAIRLSGLFLALATFGFGIMAERLFYPLGIMFTSFSEGRIVKRPSFATSDEAYYYVVLGFVVLVAVAMVAVHEARLGRVLRALSDSPKAVSTMGLSINVTRVIVFCISAFVAAVSGVLYAGSVGFAVSSDTRFSSLYSLTLIAVLAISPFREPWYAIIAGVGVVLPAYLEGPHTLDWLNALFGLFAVVIALQGGPHVMPEGLRHKLTQLFTLPSHREPKAVEAKFVAAAPRSTRSGLEVDELMVRFGGLVAVNGVTMAAPLGRITGLIGPNGAGKTTTFDACSGLNRPSSGRIVLHGRDVSSISSSARARQGLGRTFQRMELCDSLTVADNVALGREAGQAGARTVGQMVAGQGERQESLMAAAAAMEVCGIRHLANSQAGDLSTGQRRLVELARCVAGPFDVLLLDEPSSGLDHNETKAFADILGAIVRERGCAILLVEHDVNLVMQVCQYIYVLDFGELIFEGPPEAVGASPKVRAAYLGDDIDDPKLESDVQPAEIVR
jgi:ABC-type branched-subunit amino acid transport system ATPase component/branched-subunit amino acid ABC-type transport system permease component